MAMKSGRTKRRGKRKVPAIIPPREVERRRRRKPSIPLGDFWRFTGGTIHHS